jgi:hypothetical protein
MLTYAAGMLERLSHQRSSPVAYAAYRWALCHNRALIEALIEAVP